MKDLDDIYSPEKVPVERAPIFGWAGGGIVLRAVLESLSVSDRQKQTNKTWSQSVSELKAQKISNLKSVYKSKLGETDWIIIRDQELGNTTEQSVLDARAELRTECSDKEAEINALSTKSNIVKYSVPTFN